MPSDPAKRTLLTVIASVGYTELMPMNYFLSLPQADSAFPTVNALMNSAIC